MDYLRSQSACTTQIRILRVVSGLFQTFGILMLGLAVIFLFVGLYGLLIAPESAARGAPHPVDPLMIMTTPAEEGPLVHRIGGAGFLLGSFASLLSGLQLLVIGALIRLMIQIEDDVRVTARCLESIVARIPAGPGAPPVVGSEATPWFRS